VSVRRFGVFQADLATGELYKQGRLVRVQQQPFEILRALLEQPGELVTRDALRQRIWGSNITVDFDQSLNKSVTKLRDALGDHAASPRFIETLPKRGYRFIADVTPDTTSAPAEVAIAAPAPRRRSRWLTAGVGTAICAAGLIAIGVVQSSSSTDTGLAASDATRARRRAASPIHAARDAYDRGRAALARPTAESLPLAVEHFARAIALSPRYADAHVGLADAWGLMASSGMVDPRGAMPRARDAANRALTIDPGLARAHASLGRTAMLFDWDWRTAGWHFARAVALEPGHATTHQWHAGYLSAIGQHDAAIAEAGRAVAAEPLSLNANTALGYALYLARRADAAAAQLERTLEIDPDFLQARRHLALVRVQQGRLRDALRELERVVVTSRESPAALAERAWVLGLLGDRAATRREIARLEGLPASTFVPPDALALAHLGLGDRRTAAGYLRRAFEIRAAPLAHLAVEPIWDALRDLAEVRQLIDAVGAGR
jgi:DNA-binding winged helix-turn-helix (wHTH) protein/tetratricopeptide (TPR) repeat protein